jgi:hypothetical protein
MSDQDNRQALVYANQLGATPSPFDFAIDFAYVEPPAGVPPDSGVRVVMTWEFAKVLRDVLNSAIDQREGNVGEIRLPPGVELASSATAAPEPEQSESGSES